VFSPEKVQKKVPRRTIDWNNQGRQMWPYRIFAFLAENSVVAANSKKKYAFLIKSL
jgi:hypothetical protein